MGDDADPEIGYGDDGDECAPVSFPFDRMTVQRFRQEFPRARWSDRRKAWLVPGKTALRRAPIDSVEQSEQIMNISA